MNGGLWKDLLGVTDMEAMIGDEGFMQWNEAAWGWEQCLN